MTKGSTEELASFLKLPTRTVISCVIKPVNIKRREGSQGNEELASS